MLKTALTTTTIALLATAPAFAGGHEPLNDEAAAMVEQLTAEAGNGAASGGAGSAAKDVGPGGWGKAGGIGRGNFGGK